MLEAVDPDVLWPPDPDQPGPLARFAGWVREHRGVDAPDYAALHAWSVDDLEGFWSAVAEFLGVRFHDAAHAPCSDRDEMPGRRVVPRRHAELRRARPRRRPGPRRRRHRAGLRPRGRPRAHGHPAELRDAGRPGPGGARRDRRRPRRPGGRAGAELRRDAGDVPRRGQPRRDLVVLLAGLRRARRARPLRPDRADRPARRRRLRLRRASATTSARRSTRCASQLPTLRATVLVPYLDEDATLDGTLPWAEFTGDPGAARVRRRCRSTTRCGCCTPRAPPGLPKGIVHGHGGIVLEHMKALRLQIELGPGRAVLLVHHHRLDDVELPHRRPARRSRRSCCTTATPATPTSARCGSSPSGTGSRSFGVSAPFVQS